MAQIKKLPIDVSSFTTLMAEEYRKAGFLFSLALFSPLFCSDQTAQATPLKKISLDISSFRMLVEDNYLYVDKTERIHALIQAGRNYLLVRPRRFGKTLFLSTLQEIFSGNRKLFNDCWIGQNNRYDWPSYTVIKIDFMTIDDYAPDKFTANLLYKIQSLAEEHGIILPDGISIEAATTQLFQQLSKHGKIVLLVDEYDKPLRRHQDDRRAFEKIRSVLKQFYAAIGRLDDYFRAIIITGVVPYAAAELFSAIPDLKNISFAPETTELFGFTDNEMATILLPYIERYAQHAGKKPFELLQKLDSRYGGYRFAPQTQPVHCPIPVLYCLSRMEMGPYLLQTSIPTFLVELMRRYPEFFQSPKTWGVPHAYGQACELGQLTPAAALWYAGLLTIGLEQPLGDTYVLTHPNKSTSDMFTLLLSNVHAQQTANQ